MSVISTYKNKRRLEEALVKKRELEFRKAEETKARVRYYTEFDRANTHFQSWTAPEYYEKCSNQLRSSNLENEKEKKINARRERLQKMLEMEQLALENERRILEQGNKSRSRSKRVSVDILSEICSQMKIDAEERRRKEVEERLYQHWRKTEGCRLLESQEFNEHQALAKMSWMDKQVEKQLDRERIAKQQISSTLRTIEELRHEMNALHDQLKSFKRDHDKFKIALECEMKKYQDLSDQNVLLENEEKELLSFRDNLENICGDYYDENKSNIDTNIYTNNSRFKKIGLKQHNEVAINSLNHKIMILNRLQELNVACERTRKMLNSTYSVVLQQRNLQMKRKQQVEAMYDSEARRSWNEYVTKWQNEEKDRNTLFNEIINTLKKQIENKLKINLKHQKDSILGKEEHLKHIEELNCKMTLVDKDIEINNTRLTIIKSELHKLESQNDRLTAYIAETVNHSNVIENRMLSPVNSELTPKCRTPKIISPRYQDSIKDILCDRYTPTSIFSSNYRPVCKRENGKNTDDATLVDY